MPTDLARIHAALDKAVDRCYRAQGFPDECRRFEFLFDRWKRLMDPVTAPPHGRRSR
jgi:restriction-modification enzyme MmeI-like protein